MVLDVGGLASRRRLSRAERWRVPLCAAVTLVVFGGGALFLASGGGGLTGTADRGASAPDGPLPENLGPAAASGAADAHSNGSASATAGSPSTGPGGSPATQGGSGAAERDGSATPQGAASAGGGRGPDGDPGSHTPNPPAPPVPPVPPSPTPSDGTLRPGDRGNEVRTLQQRLYGQGFTFVPVDGVYGEQTRLGVAKLQSDRGLTGDPSGIYGPHTRAAFGLG
ncbi:peptidoglycan-binding protein [Streptomyces sp. NPDC059193]|uniref:peptidoglycan-binding domain-containing protein n=1 Tax=Streptomyces sp. NPDC059193 TaxID=3346763 RepID=UPI0036D1EF46